jgi:hypothetical protein
MATKKAEPTTEVQIMEVGTQSITFCILGRTPLIFNSMSAKAMRELLMPKGRKTTAEKASTLKHDPVSEYRNSMYKLGDGMPTRLYIPASAMKKAAMTAALDLPGAKKSEVGRLLWVEGDKIPVYGQPKLFMTVVRSADMNRTPDVRTRAILPEWAAQMTVTFNTVKLRSVAVTNLFAAAGITSGVGDFRQEKGAGNFGQFTLSTPGNAKFKSLIAGYGASVQDAAIKTPECWDAESEELLTWYQEEVVRRS